MGMTFKSKRQQRGWQQPELVNNPNREQRDRQVLQDKWQGGSISEPSLLKGCGGRAGGGGEVIDFHLGAPLGQYFAKPGVCNLLIKVLTLGATDKTHQSWKTSAMTPKAS